MQHTVSEQLTDQIIVFSDILITNQIYIHGWCNM